LILVVIWYAWSQHVRHTRAREEDERRRDEIRTADAKKERDESLARLEVRAGGTLYRFDFVDMYVSAVWEERPETGTTFYHLRRTSDGRWEVRISADQTKAELAQLRELYEQLKAARPLTEQDEIDLGNEERTLRERAWSALPDEIGARTEPHYQRFLRHYGT
jgi:hypothetical protein